MRNLAGLYIDPGDAIDLLVVAARNESQQDAVAAELNHALDIGVVEIRDDAAAAIAEIKFAEVAAGRKIQVARRMGKTKL